MPEPTKPKNKRAVWRLEYYNGFPNIRFGFDVVAETFEEAVRIGDAAVNSLRRSATFKLRDLE